MNSPERKQSTQAESLCQVCLERVIATVISRNDTVL